MVFLILQITIFTFLIGQSAFCYLNNDFSEFELTQEQLNFSNVAIWASLIGLKIGHVVFNDNLVRITVGRQLTQWRYGESNTDDSYIIILRKASVILFYVTYPFLMYALIDKIKFVSSYSYIELYTSYSSPLSLLASRISSISITVLYIFLGTMPEKKRCKLPLLLYAIYTILTLGTQVRNKFVINTIMIFLYFFIRDRRDRASGERWLERKTIMICIIMFPVVLILLSIMEYARVGSDYNFSIIGLIEAFFINQGGSIRVIGFTNKFRSELLDFDNYYVLGTVIWVLKYNVFTRLVFGLSEPITGTAAMAEHSNQLAHALTYLYNPLGYANGYGIGSCYIAEAYVKYGFIGIVLISIIVGLICVKTENKLFESNSPIGFSILFLLVSQIIYLPRNSFGALISQVFTFSNILMFIFLHFIAKSLSKM